MNTNFPITVADIGLVCALGDSLPVVMAAIKAGINRYQKSGIFFRNQYEISLAKIPDEILDPTLNILQALPYSVRYRRILAMLTHALKQITPGINPEESVHLFLALPENFPGYTSDIHNDIIHELSALSGLNINSDYSAIFPYGAAAGGLALEAAIESLLLQPSPQVILAGADSCIDLAMLAQLDKDRRLHNIDAMDAFVPGEAAIVLRIMPAQSSSRGNILAIANAEEPGNRYAQDQPYKGDGLAQTLTTILDSIEIAPITNIYSNLNGESFGVKELGVATLRNSKKLSPGRIINHPADCYGDIGAASFPFLIAMALATSTEPSVILCSSWGKERCGALVQPIKNR